jgi:hypothetical protein
MRSTASESPFLFSCKGRPGYHTLYQRDLAVFLFQN